MDHLRPPATRDTIRIDALDAASRTSGAIGMTTPIRKLRLVSSRGPSESFIRRRFNPDVPHSPERFEPTKKEAGDVVI
jgi:hypothetical protein